MVKFLLIIVAILLVGCVVPLPVPCDGPLLSEAEIYAISLADPDCSHGAIETDLCIQKKAIGSENLNQCHKINDCMIKNLCITEINLKKDFSFCEKNKEFQDYCTLIELREEVGFYPGDNFNLYRCDSIASKKLNAYCVRAYARKE